MKTSWNNVASWYDEHLKQETTYHKTLVIPGVLKLLAPKKGERVLDVACGQGMLVSALQKTGAVVTGIDAAPDLVEMARRQVRGATFFVGDAKKLAPFKPGSFDSATIVLALQNIDHLDPVFAELSRVLKPGGRVVFVITHPSFRIPRQSGWGWDEVRKLQYRRVDSYQSEMKIPIQMHPGKAKSQVTWTFHRSLSAYVTAFAKVGFALDGLEEWTSDRVSTQGSHARAENRSRQEIPLFLAARIRKMPVDNRS